MDNWIKINKTTNIGLKHMIKIGVIGYVKPYTCIYYNMWSENVDIYKSTYNQKFKAACTFGACLIQETGFSTLLVVIHLFVFRVLRWEDIIRFVDIDGIVDHQSSLFKRSFHSIQAWSKSLGMRRVWRYQRGNTNP